MIKDEFFSMDFENIKKLISSNEISVCVIGIGRIGLPTALSFAKSGFNTVGVDIDTELVNRINSGDFPLKDEPGYEKIFNNVLNKKFSSTNKIEDVLPQTQIILLSLPTPMDKNNFPDYSALRTVGNTLNNLMKSGTILIVESTIEPGFIENEFINIVEGDKKRLVAGKNFGLGVCPETANPGEILHDFENLPRLVAATDDKTTRIIMDIYKHVFPVEIIRMPDCKTANAVKLTTNIFRDVNIAFVNELALLFEKLGIDTLKVLEAADKKYNFQIHYPGAGVGGPCLPVNSYQMLNLANSVGNNFLKIVKVARNVNENMPNHVVDLIIEAFTEANKSIKNSKILILGISYKPNVKDIQLSPSETIIKKLKELGAQVKIYDPFFKSAKIFDIQTESNFEDAISDSDAVALITAHNEFREIGPDFFASKMKSLILIDSSGLIDEKAAAKTDLIFKGLGRGKIKHESA